MRYLPNPSSNYLLTELATQNILSVMDLVRHHDWDWLTVVYGRERVGKTDLAALIMLTAEPELDRSVLCADYAEPLRRFAWDFPSMVDTLSTLPRGGVMTYQEAAMLGREALRKWDLDMIRVMTTVGERNVHQIWTFPRFSMLDPYLRYRCRTRIHVSTMDRERGHARWYYSRDATPLDDTDEPCVFVPAFDSSFRDIRTVSPCHAEFWYTLRARETEIKSAILARHGARE